MPTYYPINETLARQANMMNSHYEYKAGSATAEYHAMVDEAAAIAEKQKARTDPMYHERIDRLLDTYARKLADNFNENFEIQTRCPSILVAGRANFPVRKKEKQNGFRWALSQGAWQRMLNQNGIYAAKQVTEAWMLVESEQAVMEEPEADAPAPSSWMQQMM